MMKEILFIENLMNEKSSQLSQAISLASAKGLRLSALFIIPVHADVSDWVDQLQNQVREAETKVDAFARKTAAELEEQGLDFRWKMIQGTSDAVMSAIGEFMPADIVLAGKLDLEPLAEKGINNLEELSSHFHCPVLPVERLSVGEGRRAKQNILRFLVFGILSAASYFIFFPRLDRLNHSLFMKGTILSGLAVMAVVAVHAYIYGSFTEYLPKFLGLDKTDGGH
jgi:hypothetical protein